MPGSDDLKTSRPQRSDLAHGVQQGFRRQPSEIIRRLSARARDKTAVNMTGGVGLRIHDCHTKGTKLLAKLPWHVTRHIPDDWRLLVDRIREGRNFVAVIDERLCIVRGDQRGRKMTDPKRGPVARIRPMKKSGQVFRFPATWHGPQMGSNQNRPPLTRCRSAFAPLTSVALHARA